jgi:hypothetical protein
MPFVKPVQQVRVDVEEVQRGRVRKTDDLEIAEQQEQVVQLGRLAPELALVRAVGRTVQEVAEVSAERHGTIIDRVGNPTVDGRGILDGRGSLVGKLGA